MVRPWVAFALLAMVVLAGCGGKASGAHKVRLGDGTQASLDLPPEQQPDKDDIRGVVSGIVVNDAIYPVPGAKVKVISGLPREVIADARAQFVLENMTPGIHSVEVSLKGHATGLGTVNVRSGEVVKLVLLMPRLPYVAPYHQTVKFDDFYSAYSTWLDSDNLHENGVGFDFAPATVIVEALWSSVNSLPNNNPLEYTVRPASVPTGGQTGTGPNPLRLQFDAAFFPEGEYAARVRVVPAIMSVPVEAKGEIWVTTFYVEAAPADWSFVGGSP